MKVLGDNRLETGNRREPIWVGLFHNTTANENIDWAWVDGKPIDFTNWAENQPNNATSAN